MTDNEIIEALEFCCDNEQTFCAETCPLCNYDGECWTMLKHAALSLINRQKAEIENYSHNNRNMTKDIRTLQKALELATAKIERLKAERDKEHDYCNHYARMCAKAKAEAIKEFAERLDARKKKRACVWSAEYEETVTISEINNLVEELVGDCDGSSKKM